MAWQELEKMVVRFGVDQSAGIALEKDQVKGKQFEISWKILLTLVNKPFLTSYERL